MATYKHGMFGNYRGKIGNLVFYVVKGKQRVRSLGINSKPPTVAQLQSRQQMGIVIGFLKPLKEFVTVGFGQKAKGKSATPYNFAVSYNRRHAVTGTYPDVTIAYDKVLVTEGSWYTADDPLVVLTESGLHFSWSCTSSIPWPVPYDQVILLAYFPELEKAVYLLYGARRSSCEDQLALTPDLLNAHMEVYISFISSDRKKIANSTYLGSFNKLL
jgi:hypothetical protein